MEVTGCWTGFEGYVIWLLRMMCLKTWSAVIIPLYKSKGERTEFNNYRGVSLLSFVGKRCTGILAETVRRVTGSLIGDEQRDFRAEWGCVDQVFTLKQIGENVRDKKHSVCGFHGFGEGI